MSEYKFGWVALIGPPNAGKSTLMNHYLGQKVAIVSPKPQTTRNRISGILSNDDSQVVFLDTPGIHRMRGKMNRFLLDSAWEALGSANAIVILFDAALYAAKPHLMEEELAPIVKPVNNSGRPIFVAVNKVDKVKDKARLLPVMEKAQELWPEADFFPVSALKGEGADVLLEKVIDKLPEGPPMFPEDQVSTVPMRFMASETIREKLFMSLQQELPYSTAVEIEFWNDEQERNLVHIGAIIYTTKKNHKGMIIGKGGQNLKKIGTQSRVELEEMLEQKVMLELWVKVREGWTEDVGFLRSIGLGE
ncbi:GTPase Era [Maridesulfovibrio hydrothermalis]|uniref:GTPase Era n=1 Tax=Maridesulfovibrio hydrothermalis AM13 = DSM 14728 TaxID=1121451 RepID=L0RBW5_9BACT|nr:GTPase Era [Maridesulfovibrio hydrothermalis]CCO23041.1 GTPase Era [Maridesulfovibrio hydrothermalis AM13 = DSM 14728]